MLLSSLLLIPIIGVIFILINKDNAVSLTNIKFIGLTASIINLFISLIIFILYDFSTNQFQFVQEYHEISYFDFYLGVDGLSIYFILLTTIIIPISLLSNWTSISKDVESYVIIILLLETLLLFVFLVLDILLFYIFFESILPPLFILIGIYGSDNRVKASFYLFLYTLLGSLFLLLSILAMSSIMSVTDFDTLFKGNFVYITQLFLFYGIFIAFAVKTPTIFLNTWLLKAHVESPLGGSIILAAIVLKLSLYGILRLILPLLPKAYMEYTYIIYLIGVITIIYASLSTLRTIDVKELIAYSSVSHAAVYLLGVFSNNIQGIEGSIILGLAHGLVSPGLFICAGGVLYDRSHTRIIGFYRGMAQLMPLFAILFFILCLANCGAPLSLNFIGEFLSLYGVFERSSLLGLFASLSIIFSAGYTMLMYQKISLGGSFSRYFTINIPDLNKREFMVLLTLTVLTVVFGVYPAPLLDAIHYSVSTLIYSFDFNLIGCDASSLLDGYSHGSSNLIDSSSPMSTNDDDDSDSDTSMGSDNSDRTMSSVDSTNTEDLAERNQEREELIEEYKAWNEEVKSLKEIIDKNPEERTEDDIYKWNSKCNDPANAFLKEDEVSATDLRKELNSTTERINDLKDQLRLASNNYGDASQLSDNEKLLSDSDKSSSDSDESLSDIDDSSSQEEFFIIILPGNFPVISIILLAIRKRGIYPLLKLYLIYLKDIISHNFFAIVVSSFTILSVIWLNCKTIKCDAPDAWGVYSNVESDNSLFDPHLWGVLGLGLVFIFYNPIKNYIWSIMDYGFYKILNIINTILADVPLIYKLVLLYTMLFNLYLIILLCIVTYYLFIFYISDFDLVDCYYYLNGDLAKLGHTPAVSSYPVGMDSTVCLSTQATGSDAIATKSLQSDKGISEIVKQINFLMPQLSNFIVQFNNTVSETGINVVTDSAGNMSIDVPDRLSHDEANKISTRIGIIDRLITTRGQEINELLHKGTLMESKIKMENPNYVSQLTDKIEEFKRLNMSYKH